jgi:hypothetical protein
VSADDQIVVVVWNQRVSRLKDNLDAPIELPVFLGHFCGRFVPPNIFFIGLGCAHLSTDPANGRWPGHVGIGHRLHNAEGESPDVDIIAQTGLHGLRAFLADLLLKQRASLKVFIGMTDKAHSQDRQRTGSVACRNKVRHYHQPDILIDRQRVQKLAISGEISHYQEYRTWIGVTRRPVQIDQFLIRPGVLPHAGPCSFERSRDGEEEPVFVSCPTTKSRLHPR